MAIDGSGLLMFLIDVGFGLEVVGEVVAGVSGPCDELWIAAKEETQRDPTNFHYLHPLSLDSVKI